MVLKIKSKRPVAVLPDMEKMPHDGLVPGSGDGPVALPKALVLAPSPLPTGDCASGCTTPAKRVTPDSEGAVTVESRLKRKRLTLIGKHMPRMHCNNCVVTDRCPKYKAGYECAYAEDLIKRIHGPKDVEALLVAITEAAVSRAQMAVLLESMSGSGPSPVASEALDGAFAKLQAVREMLDKKPADDKPKGVVALLFGNILGNTAGNNGRVIDITPGQSAPQKQIGGE